MNLVICLLSTRQFLSAEQIRKIVGGYETSKTDEAFNRMFERDKNELRDLGIPLETGRSSGLSPVDGYRIDRDAYELSDVDLTEEEAAAVALAAALWDSPGLAANTHSALMKLRAAGVQVDADAVFEESAPSIHSSAPRGIGSQEVLTTLLAAVDARRQVRFEHRSAKNQPYQTRTMKPWGVVTHQRRWYLVGHDVDRGEPRTFRLSRIASVEPFGRSGVVVQPDDVDLRAIVAEAVTVSGPPRIARIWVADNRAAGLRRIASGSSPGVFAGRDGTVLDVAMNSIDGLSRQVLGAGADAVVVEPPELRDHVVNELRTLTGGGS
ncbi:helix-turn-helix transcriptional regulator [Gordonia rubripertincta]|uniref:WYL domain-containing protein n=1 Tax=Gordonia rubripertincta TaxID=36822 RepID=A0ABT4MWT5_GORRU|nr:WYL domain-containing protein [Gordonia rubripertincta]MCZ4550681.1 WYL domain-containing protein [Gordonia rubripertincta]